MRQIWVRPAMQGEGEIVLQWMMANPENGFDPDVICYPSTMTFCAFDQNGPIAYMPVQRPLMLESLAIKPDAAPERVSLALKELIQQAITQAHIQGAGEIYFLGSSDETNKFAANQLFEELPYKVYRVKLADLESGRCT